MKNCSVVVAPDETNGSSDLCVVSRDDDDDDEAVAAAVVVVAKLMTSVLLPENRVIGVAWVLLWRRGAVVTNIAVMLFVADDGDRSVNTGVVVTTRPLDVA